MGDCMVVGIQFGVKKSSSKHLKTRLWTCDRFVQRSGRDNWSFLNVYAE